MNKPLPIPLQLDDPDRGVEHFVRAVIASGLSALDKRTTPNEYARRQWNDRNIDLVLSCCGVACDHSWQPGLGRGGGRRVLFQLELICLIGGIGLNFSGAASIKVPGIAVPTARPSLLNRKSCTKAVSG